METYGPPFAGSDNPPVEPKQIHFADVEEGMSLPHKTKGPLTITDLVVFSGATGDFTPIHHDRDYSKNIANLPDVILHGQCKIAFMTHVVTDWIGLKGRILTLGAQYRGMDIIGDTIVSYGKVSSKYNQNGNQLVDLELWSENSRAGITLVGHATVSLP